VRREGVKSFVGEGRRRAYKDAILSEKGGPTRKEKKPGPENDIQKKSGSRLPGNRLISGVLIVEEGEQQVVFPERNVFGEKIPKREKIGAAAPPRGGKVKKKGGDTKRSTRRKFGRV